jgi:hypothetical protein
MLALELYTVLVEVWALPPDKPTTGGGPGAADPTHPAASLSCAPPRHRP